MKQNRSRNTSFEPRLEARSVLSSIMENKFKILVFLTTALVAYLGSGVFSLPPLHASCKIDWVFSAECANIRTKLVNQINAMEGPDGCKNGGEKCLYKLTGQSANQINATHTTPVKHYVDDLTFSFQQADPSTCKVHGYSTSETWYAILDYGTNYCNLENLITESGLNNTSGYKESTSNSDCTQYSTANCDKY